MEHASNLHVGQVHILVKYIAISQRIITYKRMSGSPRSFLTDVSYLVGTVVHVRENNNEFTDTPYLVGRIFNVAKNNELSLMMLLFGPSVFCCHMMDRPLGLPHDAKVYQGN